MINLENSKITASVKLAESLTNNLSTPRTEWAKVNRQLLKFEIVIEDLIARKVIKRKDEKQMRMNLIHITEWKIINAPNFKNDEERKKRMKILLLNNRLNLLGLSKNFCVLDCE